MSDLDKALDLYDKSITLVGVEAIRPLAEAARAHRSCQQPDYALMVCVTHWRIYEASRREPLATFGFHACPIEEGEVHEVVPFVAALSGDSP